MTHDIVGHTAVVQKLLDSGTPFVSVTLVDIRGSAPQVLGAKAIITAAGIEVGTVGGGKVEAAAIRHAQHMIENLQPACELVVWNLQTEIGMTCGGEVKLFFELQAQNSWPIAVFGAGHVAQALIRLLVQLDCHITCIDSRQEWLDKLPSHPRLKAVCRENPCELVAAQPPHTYFVLMSKGHATDLPVLAELLRTRQAPYVGVIGSPQKASVLRRDLKALNIAPEKISSFHCPMGLPIGNNTPVEISISIIAQLLQTRDEAVNLSR